MAKLETGIPIPEGDGRGRQKGVDRLAIETLYASPKGSSVFFPFPSKSSRLSATCQVVGGSGWYAIRSDGLGIRVWKIRDTPSEDPE